MDIPLDQLQMQGIDPLQGKRFLVRKRDGRLEEFNEARIFLAIESAFKAHLGVSQDEPLPDSPRASVTLCADKVVEQVLSRAIRGEELEVERIQDAVENQLMLGGHLEVVRCFILYRDQRRRTRMQREGDRAKEAGRTLTAGKGNAVLSRLKSIYAQALPKARAGETPALVGRRHFDCYLNEGDYLRCLTPDLLYFEAETLARGLRWERDAQWSLAGLELLCEKYLAHEDGRRFETPQYFWMRVAMGLALPERAETEERALEFYDVLSALRFIPSEAILSHSGKPNPKLIAYEDPGVTGGGNRLEIWHRDVLDLLQRPGADFTNDLRIPDLFMKRLQQKGQWTLLDPAEAAELNGCRGAIFESRYHDYEKAGRSQIGFAQQINALDLWQNVIGSTAKTGGIRIVFKDALRHCASQNGNDDHPETPPARPLGAINLAAHIREGGLGLDVGLLRETITVAVRMLDNAIDVNVCPSDLTRAASAKHRPIGLGLVGFNETLARLKISPGTAAAADFADWSAELVSHCAILASSELARERGFFPGYPASRWSEGILPIDTMAKIAKERGLKVNPSTSFSQDWDRVREIIRRHGLRNGMIMTADPLETPAKIAGVACAPAIAENDPTLSIECAARRQKWSDVSQSLTLPEKSGGADPGVFHMQAWQSGIGRIIPCATARVTKRSLKSAAPKDETLAAV